MNQRVSAAPQGSASILPISWMYIRMMGGDGLRKASEISLLSANWLAHKIDSDFKVLYKAKNGRVAHECIFDCRNLPVSAEDIAKRLMDYGFHAPTLSWPVTNTMMVEPSFPNQPKKKFWPAVSRIDNVYGDRNLVCSCSDYFTQEEKTPVERLHDDIRKSIGKI